MLACNLAALQRRLTGAPLACCLLPLLSFGTCPVHQPHHFLSLLAKTPQATIEKVSKHARREAAESKREKRLQTAAKAATTAATVAYLEHLEKEEAGTEAHKGRAHFAEAHGITVRMMITAEQHIKRPVQENKVGKPGLFTQQDHITVGFAIVNRAITKSCYPWQDVRALYLQTLNARRQVNGQSPMLELSDRTWGRTRKHLIELWESFQVPIVTKRRAATLCEKRLKAEKNDLKGFFASVLSEIHQRVPEAADAARHLNGDESPGVQQPDKMAGTSVAAVPTIQQPKARSEPKAPQSFSIWTTSLANGCKGPVGFIHEDKSPVKHNWFKGQLPPNISKDWLADGSNAFFAYNDTSDRMRLDMFLDICQNKLLPFHRKVVHEGPLFWLVSDNDLALCQRHRSLVVADDHRDDTLQWAPVIADTRSRCSRCRYLDGPTCHGVSDNYKLDGRLIEFALTNQITIVILPHNTSQAVQPQVCHVGSCRTCH